MPGFGSSPFGAQFGAGLSSHIAGLISDCLTATNVATTNVAYREKILAILNYTYLHLLQGKQWSFTNREQSFELTQPYERGTVALVQDSSVIAEDTVPAVISWNARVVGQLFAPTAGDYTYRIIELETPKKLILAADYTGKSAALSSYQILFDRYQATAHVQELKSLTIGGYGEISLVQAHKFREYKESNPSLTGIPKWATIVESEEDTGQLTIEVFPAPDQRYTATLEYSQRPERLLDTETCFTMLPPEHLPALYYGALQQIYILQNNPAMAAEVGKLAFKAALKLSSDHRVTDPVARIQHGRRYFNRPRRHRGFFGTRWFGKVED